MFTFTRDQYVTLKYNYHGRDGVVLSYWYKGDTVDPTL